MSQNKEEMIKPFTIGELFSSKEGKEDSDKKYRIPLYQRNFSWGKPEVKQLIRDIADFAYKRSNQKYYLGILVVYKRKINGEVQYEVVDGQQRLTVLLLLMRAFQNDEVEITPKAEALTLELNFAHRPKAQNTLKAISRNKIHEPDEQKIHHEINRVYDHIPAILNEEIADVGCTKEEFYSYLTNNVILYRSSLPEDTELNHYFEVMNNRGEQLEKHEILKADLMSTAEHDKQLKAVIHQVWEACSDMNRYVQYSFTKYNEKPLFGEEWNKPSEWFAHDSYEILSREICKTGDADREALSINDIINGEKPKELESSAEDKNPDRFQPVINFPNFLLQVLRIYQKKYDDSGHNYASLDDKALLEQFKTYSGDKVFVKQFIVLLLKLRFLLDQYVVKRSYEGDKDEWSLLKLNCYPKTGDRKQNTTGYKNTFGKDNGFSESQNERVLKLLTMLHVSTPTQNYKHWLTGVLGYLERGSLENEQDICADSYIKYLESFTRKLFFDRFMVGEKEQKANYEDIVFRTSSELQKLDNQDVKKDLLRFNKVKNNLVFNYLDYLIWRKKSDDDERVKNFEFKFRSSVEHFNPRSPKEHTRLGENELHSFGNLCLIAHGKNSAFGNNNPLAKAHSDTTKTSLDSLKLHLMMEKAKEEGNEDLKYGGWEPEQVKNHEEEMISYFKAEISNI